MPLYEYCCPSCGVFEELQSLHEEPLKICPHCGRENLEKIMSAYGRVIFKGQGFYETDYKSKEKKEE